jgi:hypothetical protein
MERLRRNRCNVLALPKVWKLGPSISVTSDDKPISIREQAIRTALAFLAVQRARKTPADLRRREQAIVLKLRDSLTYRFESLPWHSHLLGLLRSSAERRLATSLPGRIEDHSLMMLAGSEQQWVFDDLVFNSLAAFDYLGNFVGFAYYGDRRRKAKWDRIQKFARDKAYETQQHPLARVSTGPVGAVINEAHAMLVGGLSDYRAALIHYEALVGQGTVNTHFGANVKGGMKRTLEMRPPSEFNKYLRRQSEISGESLQDAAAWIVSATEQQILTVLKQLERDLRVEGGSDSETGGLVIEMLL